MNLVIHFTKKKGKKTQIHIFGNKAKIEKIEF